MTAKRGAFFLRARHRFFSFGRRRRRSKADGRCCGRKKLGPNSGLGAAVPALYRAPSLARRAELDDSSSPRWEGRISFSRKRRKSELGDGCGGEKSTSDGGGEEAHRFSFPHRRGERVPERVEQQLLSPRSRACSWSSGRPARPAGGSVPVHRRVCGEGSGRWTPARGRCSRAGESKEEGLASRRGRRAIAKRVERAAVENSRFASLEEGRRTPLNLLFFFLLLLISLTFFSPFFLLLFPTNSPQPPTGARRSSTSTSSSSATSTLASRPPRAT